MPTRPGCCLGAGGLDRHQGGLNDHLCWGWAQVGSQAEILEWTDWRPINLPGERLSISCCAQRLGRTLDNTHKERHVPVSQVG